MSKTIKILIGLVIVILIMGIGYYFYSKLKTFKETIPTSNTQKSTKPDFDEIERTDEPEQKQGPYYHKIYSAISTDGLTWGKQNKMLFDHCSVPGAVIKDGIIYLYFVDASFQKDRLSVAISKDLGKTFEKHKVKIKNMASIDSVDPHPILVDKKIRLYYLGNFTELPKQGSSAEFKIYSAQSSNGIDFTDQKLTYTGEQGNTDPDVFQTDDDWRMLISKGTGLDLAISNDGGLTFTKDDSFSWNQGGVCDTFNFDGIYRTFYCAEGIKSATGANTGKLTAEQDKRLDIDENGQMICDPSIIQLPDKTYMMFYKIQEMSQMDQPGGSENPAEKPGQLPPPTKDSPPHQ